MIKLKDILLEGMGDCYQAAGRLIMKYISNGKLVHGMVNGQGRLNGIRFGHAWVEVGSKVLDHSNGQKRSLPKKVYYALGRIKPSECKYYKYQDAAKFMVSKGHWGPWEMSGDTVMAEDIPDVRGEIGKKKIKISKDILNKLDEAYDLKDHPKKKWIKQPLGSIDDRIMDVLFKIYSAVYSSEGLDLSAFSASELRSSYEVVMLIDVDKDPMPDAFIFTRGKRLKLLATDGQGISKSLVIKKAVSMVKSGYSLEGSKKMDKIMKSKGAPVVMDKKKIEKMVGPKFIKHLEDGYYERKLKKGGKVVKRMYGR